MVNDLDLSELERQETLITASEGLLGLSTDRLLHICGGGSGRRGSAEVPVRGTAEDSSAAGEQDGVGAARAAGLGGIAADGLRSELAMMPSPMEGCKKRERHTLLRG